MKFAGPCATRKRKENSHRNFESYLPAERLCCQHSCRFEAECPTADCWPRTTPSRRARIGALTAAGSRQPANRHRSRSARGSSLTTWATCRPSCCSASRTEPACSATAPGTGRTERPMQSAKSQRCRCHWRRRPLD